MSNRFPAWTALVLATAVPMWLLAAPAAAQAKGGSGSSSSGSSGASSGGQASSGAASGGGHASSGGGGHASSGGGGGHAASGGGGGHASAGSSGSGRVSSGGSSHTSSVGSGRVNAGGRTTGSAAPRGGAQRGPGESSGAATARGAGRTGDAAASGGSVTANGNNNVPPYARPRNGQPTVGQAVPRSSLPPATGGTVLIVPGSYGGYYPWGFAGLGFAGGYYGSYSGYDPDFGADSYYPQYQSNGRDDSGGLKLKVKPSDATVYVDGYYVGVVNDFDSVFQKLTMEPGAHRVEIRANGYETLQIDVRIEPGRTSTYRGELKKLQN